MVRYVQQEYEAEVPIQGLHPHPRNPWRGNTGEIEKSIDANGFYGAVKVQKSTGYILAGNHTWEAALDMGAAFIPVIWLDVDDREAEAIMLADNKYGQKGNWDEDSVILILEDRQANVGLEGTGFSDEDLYELKHGKKPSDKAKRLWVRIECQTLEDQDRIASELITLGYDAMKTR